MKKPKNDGTTRIRVFAVMGILQNFKTEAEEKKIYQRIEKEELRNLR
ncbi:MAG: hypothetical protein LUE29_03020 [Lachnospiraceae bacterium]|nr:hypothetical protein [Lachnospiraceae bacterium]